MFWTVAEALLASVPRPSCLLQRPALVDRERAGKGSRDNSCPTGPLKIQIAMTVDQSLADGRYIRSLRRRRGDQSGQ